MVANGSFLTVLLLLPDKKKPLKMDLGCVWRTWHFALFLLPHQMGRVP
jgi:hypothetical protein